MDLEKLKLELIEWVKKLENQDTIEFLKVIKDSQTENDWSEDLTPELKSGIEKGLNDIEDGRVTPHEDIKRQFGL